MSLLSVLTVSDTSFFLVINWGISFKSFLATGFSANNASVNWLSFEPGVNLACFCFAAFANLSACDSSFDTFNATAFDSSFDTASLLSVSACASFLASWISCASCDVSLKLFALASSFIAACCAFNAACSFLDLFKNPSTRSFVKATVSSSCVFLSSNFCDSSCSLTFKSSAFW